MTQMPHISIDHNSSNETSYIIVDDWYLISKHCFTIFEALLRGGGGGGGGGGAGGCGIEGVSYRSCGIAPRGDLESLVRVAGAVTFTRIETEYLEVSISH